MMTETQRMVCEILEEKPIARTDDFILYGFVLKKCGVSLDMPLREFLQNQAKLDVPSFKTVERVRRDIQAVRLDLVEFKTEEARRKAEEKYHERFGRK